MPYEQLAGIFQALSHPARLRALALLAKDELRVCDIVEQLELTQSNVSQHLGLLRRENLVQSRRDGNQMIYSLTCPCIMDLVIAAKQVAIDRPLFPHEKDLASITGEVDDTG